jgi:hypothetical protein
MALVINVIESKKQIIAEIPDYLTISMIGTTNAVLYYTLDGSNPDPTGNSLSTIIMEHAVGNPLNGTIFLPTQYNFLELSMLAVGIEIDNTATFYRRYGLDNKKIGTRAKLPFHDGGSGYVNTPSISRDGRQIIAPDGYTEGYTVKYGHRHDRDGYDDGYFIAVSGKQEAIPLAHYDHIYGYTDYTNKDGYSTTTLTPSEELNLVKLSNRGTIFVVVPDPTSPTGSRLVAQNNLANIDPRSSTVIDSNGDQILVIPKQTDAAGYTDGYHEVTDDFDDAPTPLTTNFTSGGIFNPKAMYIEIDGRVDGYINGQPIMPGDRTIINKPYGTLDYVAKREDLGDAVRERMRGVSGGLVCQIVDFNKKQMCSYYADMKSNRWVVSLQKVEPPKYEVFARRNGVVVGQCFKWIMWKGQMLPG